jgi:hypothetical protein
MKHVPDIAVGQSKNGHPLDVAFHSQFEQASKKQTRSTNRQPKRKKR